MQNLFSRLLSLLKSDNSRHTNVHIEKIVIVVKDNH